MGFMIIGILEEAQIDSKGSDSNVYATYIRLNANLNITNDNVAAVSGTNLAPGTNVITSVAGANAITKNRISMEKFNIVKNY